MSVGVLFVIDCTGSMERIHRYLGKSLAHIVKMFDEEEVPVQFACIGFRDYKADPNTAFEIIDFNSSVLPPIFSASENRLVNWLNTVQSFGGGSNFGESSLSAIVHGIQEVTWPDVKRRVIALFTDDKPHLEDYLVSGWDGAKQLISEAEIEQIHLFTVNRKIDSYDDLDGHEYVVIRHKLAESAIDDMVDDDLESAMRNFVKVSSSGNFGPSEIIIRDDDDFEINPFDFDDDDLDDSVSPGSTEGIGVTPEPIIDDNIAIDWDDLD